MNTQQAPPPVQSCRPVPTQSALIKAHCTRGVRTEYNRYAADSVSTVFNGDEKRFRRSHFRGPDMGYYVTVHRRDAKKKSELHFSCVVAIVSNIAGCVRKPYRTDVELPLQRIFAMFNY